MEARDFVDPTGITYSASPLELDESLIKSASDMQASTPYQLPTPAASLTEEFPNDYNESYSSDMVYNSQGQGSIDPVPLTSSATSKPQSKNKKERNRKAAHKCRQKSKANIEQLKRREEELSQRNRDLKDAAYGLRNEVLYLKNEVLMHGTTCNNVPIQNYLAGVVDDLVDRNPT